MKRLIKFAGMFAALAVVGMALLPLVGGSVQAQEPELISALEPGTLFVTGSATITTVADEASVDISVSALDDSAVGAIVTASAAMNTVIADIFDLGVATDDIRTTSVTLSPEYEFTSNGRSLIGFRFTNSIRVAVRDIANLGPVIDAAVGAGGDLVSLNGIRFIVSNRSALEDQARLAAIDDAIARATAMAERAGVTLGRAVLIRALGFATPAPIAFDAAPAESFGTSIFAGTDDVTVSVEMQFEIF